MLRDFEALHHVEASPEVDWPAQIRCAKLICIDHQVFCFDVRAVDAHYSGAGLPPYVQPSAVAASEIDNAADLQRGAQQRNDLLRRTDRKGRQETVEIFVVFVQMLLPPVETNRLVRSKPLEKNEQAAPVFILATGLPGCFTGS